MLGTYHVGKSVVNNLKHFAVCLSFLKCEAYHRRDQNREKESEMFYLTTHSTHFIYGYMASDIWLRTILIVRKETRCRHIGYKATLIEDRITHTTAMLHQSCSTGWNEK